MADKVLLAVIVIGTLVGGYFTFDVLARFERWRKNRHR